MPKYAWMGLNEQDLEYALGPKYPKILWKIYMLKWHSSEYVSANMLEYTLV